MRRVALKSGLLFVVLMMLVGALPVAASTDPGLGAAGGYAVIAGTALTCTDSNVVGPVGLNFTTAPTLTRCKIQVEYAPDAYNAFQTKYTYIADNLGPCDQTFGSDNTLAGVILGPGTYCFDAAAALTGTLTLTGGGPWTFEIGATAPGALTANSFRVVSDNPCNAFWWVQADVTMTDSAFQGTILGGGDITLTRTSLEGRAWATHALTMTGSNIFGCNAAATVAKHHCNQGVGNGPEGCDPGNSNNKNKSNDELGGVPGRPGRMGYK